MSLALTCRWTSLRLALSFLAAIASFSVGNKFVPADFGTRLPFLNMLATYGVVALLAVAFSQIAYYFKPDDAMISKQARIMARLPLVAAAGYVLLVPLFSIASVAAPDRSVDFYSITIGCVRFLAMAIGFLGASRTQNRNESLFLENSVASPLAIG